MSTSYGGTPPGITGTHYGGPGLGVLGALVPSEGEAGAGYLYAGLDLPADAGKEEPEDDEFEGDEEEEDGEEEECCATAQRSGRAHGSARIPCYSDTWKV